jgi:MFS family permease
MTTEECTSKLCVDLAVAAASHAQVMGVLAGFAAAAIAVVLQRPRSLGADNRNQPHNDGIPALFVALIALLAAAFLYGTTAGAEANPQRVAAMTLAAGLPAAAAVSSLAFGLLGLLLDSAHWELTGRGATYVAIVIPAGTSIYVFVSAADVLGVDASDEPSETDIAVLVGTLGIVVFLLLVLVAAAAVPALRRSLPPLSVLHGALKKGHRADEAVLGFASLAIVGFGLAYFLVLLYVRGASSNTWVIPILVASWVAYVVIFIQTSSGMQRPTSPSDILPVSG